MPVSKISVSGSRFSNSGASRWIGYQSSGVTSAPSSTVSPSTLKMRPSVDGPTGMSIGGAGVDGLHAAA